MSEAKFTKGPWRILDKYQVGIDVNFGDGFFTIASCQAFNEAKANAHLIAAAPEMYYALQEALPLISHKAVIGVINEALAKARGEQND